jgi:hypothetical protein
MFGQVLDRANRWDSAQLAVPSHGHAKAVPAMGFEVHIPQTDTPFHIRKQPRFNDSWKSAEVSRPVLQSHIGHRAHMLFNVINREQPVLVPPIWVREGLVAAGVLIFVPQSGCNHI